jgi:hypothetical protein
VEVANTATAGTDEVLTLSALQDSSFGNITLTGGNVLGTTCGVGTGSFGSGTLSGSLGGGTLPASITVGGSYTCEFDGKFCGALGNAGPNCTSGLEHINTVTATVAGDEGEAATGSTSSTLTVDVCFSSHN